MVKKIEKRIASILEGCKSYKEQLSILLGTASKITKSNLLNISISREDVLNAFNSNMFSALKEIYTDEEILMVLGKMGEILIDEDKELGKFLVEDDDTNPFGV